MRCDSHVHIVGSADRYPQVPARTYLADVATLETLRRNGAARGISRFVIVQPSFYGIDNTLLLETLDALAGEGRGVAVIDPKNISDAELADYARRGVRGLRINLYSPLEGPSADRLEATFNAMAKVAQTMNWHVQVIAHLPVLLANFDLLGNAKVPVVIDHYGLYGKTRPESAEGQRLLDLLRMPHVWVKLSGPYRQSDNHLNTMPDADWLAAILAVARNRSLWGSDWPWPPPHDQHKGGAVIAPYRALSYQTVVDDFLGTLPVTELAERIMRDNPERFYEF